MSSRGGRYNRRSRGGGQTRGRGGGGGHAVRLNGLFENSTWHCNCKIRLPAVDFVVKKEGPNKGRRFYTCQNPQTKRCDFFLWAEDARPREALAVLSNSKSEPVVDKDEQEGRSAGRQIPPTPQKVDTTTTLPLAANVGMKRNARDAGLFEDDSDDEAFSLTGQEKEELVKVADSAALETPHKAQKMGVYATPATTEKRPRKLPWLQESATPVSGKKTVTDYFGSSPSKHPEPTSFAAELPATPVPREEPATASTSSLPDPPSPSPTNRYKNALINPADRDCALSNEVLTELSSIDLPPQTVANLRSILSKHDLRTRGVVKGRDISRLALKAKEAKIVELQARINSLQAEKEVDRGLIVKLKWQLERGGEDAETDDEL